MGKKQRSISNGVIIQKIKCYLYILFKKTNKYLEAVLI